MSITDLFVSSSCEQRLTRLFLLKQAQLERARSTAADSLRLRILQAESDAIAAALLHPPR